MTDLIEEIDRTKIILGGWGLFLHGNTTVTLQARAASSALYEVQSAIAAEDNYSVRKYIGAVFHHLICAGTLAGVGSQRLSAISEDVYNATPTSLIRLLLSIPINVQDAIAHLNAVARNNGANLAECLAIANNINSKIRGKYANGVFIHQDVYG